MVELWEQLGALHGRAREAQKSRGEPSGDPQACREAKQKHGIRLTPQTLSDWRNARVTAPRDFAPLWALVQVWSYWAGETPQRTLWTRLYDGAAPDSLASLASTGVARVCDADPRLLGVHRPIHVTGAGDGLPTYVPRDTDTAPDGVRAKVTAAAESGGFVLVVGPSSVGKTRTAYEAMHDLLSDWSLLQPTGPAELTEVLEHPPERLVVWLDEVQRHLDGAHGLTAAHIRGLMGLPRPVVLVGTLWPHHHTAYTRQSQGSEQDVYRWERELIDLADVVHLEQAFSRAETARARQIAATDPRIRAALNNRDYGLTQVIAAAPLLVDRWRGADPYAQAVLRAAIDATHLGARSPLPAALLRDAAPGYCTPRQRATAPANWFEAALAYATETLHGAVAALEPMALGQRMGEVSGYQVADYLMQYVSTPRRYSTVPATTWDALSRHLADPDDLIRTAEAAERRLLYRHATMLYRRCTDLGRVDATDRLVNLLIRQDKVASAVSVLREHANAAGGTAAAIRLANLLAAEGLVDELRSRADASDAPAAQRLADLLMRQGRLDEVRIRAEAGDAAAADQLDLLPLRQRRIDEVTARLDTGDISLNQAADLLIELNEVNEAIALVRIRADAGASDAAYRLGDLLLKHGREEELRARADAGDLKASQRLVDLLIRQGRVPELEERADAGDFFSASRLAGLLIRQGRVERLKARADTGDGIAASRLADFLAENGRVDELRARAETGDHHAVSRLAKLLIDRGEVDEAIAALSKRASVRASLVNSELALVLEQHDRIEELRAQADSGEYHAAGRLAALLLQRGRVDELRVRADTGDQEAARRLVNHLARHELAHELWVRADAGDHGAACGLARLLVERGETDEAIVVLHKHIDDHSSAKQLAELLAGSGRIDELVAAADAGVSAAAQHLAVHLATRGLLDQLGSRADSGDHAAALKLAELLTTQNQVDELRARADHGDDVADRHVAQYLASHDRLDELRDRAETSGAAAIALAKLIADRGLLEDAIDLLRKHADHYGAADPLARLLLQSDRIDELRARADAGDHWATERLTEYLASHDQLDELRERAETSDTAATKLAQALADRGHTSEAIDVLRDHAGHHQSDALLAGLLLDQGREADLARYAAAGNTQAAEGLRRLLASKTSSDASRFRRLGLLPDGSIADTDE